MKVRKGFVSNSSSSSFIVFVKSKNVIKWSDLADWVKENTFEDHELWVLKYICGCDGDWSSCRVDKELLDLLIKNAYRDWSDLIILVDPIWFSESDDFFGFRKLDEFITDTKDIIFCYFDIDYNGFNTTKDWKEVFEDLED